MSSAASPESEPIDELLLRLLRTGGEDAVRSWVARNSSHREEVEDLLPVLHALEGLAASERSRSERPATPERIGDFRIVREIGRGGMGVVFEAEQESMGRRVALKMLPRSSFAEERAVTRFRREAQAAGRLRHDNIIPVYGVGELEGQHYYVMQFVDGQGVDRLIAGLRLERWRADTTSAPAAVTSFFDLDTPTERIRLEGGGHAESAPAPGADPPTGGGARSGSRFRAAARLARDVADALTHAHDNGILHRDIKPSNLILDGDGRVWVADFGLAKAYDAADLTHTGEVVGTPLYMAPEMFRGEACVRSDVYSLGLVLYELVTLTTAFKAGPRAEMMLRVLETVPRMPRDVEPRVPRDLETIVLKAIHRDAHDRYPDAASMRDDLRRFLEGRPVLARRTHPVQRALKWVRRHPAPTCLAVIIVVMAFIALRASGRADEAERMARSDHEQAVAAIDRLTSFGEDRLRDVPGGTGARREMLVEALAAYRRLLAKRGDDALRLQTAIAMRRVGWIESELGNMAAAEAGLEEALAFCDDIAPEGSDDGVDFERGMALDVLSQTLQATGRYAEALTLAQRADGILARLAAAHPQSHDHVDSAAGAANNLANLQRHNGLPGALEAQRRAVELMAGLSSNVRYRRRWLAQFRLNLAISVSRTGDLVEARQLLESAMETLDDGQDSEARGIRVSIVATRAAQHRQAGEVDHALVAYEEALAIADGLVGDFPVLHEHRSRRAEICSDYGVMLDDSCLSGGECRHEAARRMTRRAIDDMRELEERFGLAGLRLPRARSLGNLGRSFLMHGESAQDAERAWLEMLELLDSIQGTRAGDLERATALNHLALVGSFTDPTAALRRYERSIAILERLAQDDPRSADVRHNLAGTLNNLAELLRQRGERRRAREVLERGIALETELLEAAPDSGEKRLFLLNLRYNLALVSLESGDHEEAVELAAEFGAALPGAEAATRAREVVEKAIERARLDPDFEGEDLEELIADYRAVLLRSDS